MCTGITVWQLPHRQIWWEPRWRTDWQPCSRSLRTKARAVTALVYLVRRRSVQVGRRSMDRWPFEVGVGECIAHRGPDGDPEEVADPADVSPVAWISCRMGPLDVTSGRWRQFHLRLWVSELPAGQAEEFEHRSVSNWRVTIWNTLAMSGPERGGRLGAEGLGAAHHWRAGCGLWRRTGTRGQPLEPG